MKKVVVLLLAVLLAFAVIGCKAASSTPSAAPSASKASAAASTGFNGTYTIGVFQPLTGNSSLMGTAGTDAVKLAAEQFNAAGGILGKEVKIVSYDDKSSPEEAVKDVNKMIEVDKVDAIVGSLHSGNIQAVGDIVEKAKIPLLGTGTSPQWLKKGWTYLFRPTLNTYYSSLSAIQACDALGIKSIAIFHSDDEYGKNGKDNMTKLCGQYNINILGVESMTPGDSDFTAQVANLAKAAPDAVYIIATTDNLPAMVKQTRAGGVNCYILGEQSLGAPEVKDVAGAAADKIVYGACFVMPIKAPEEAQLPKLVQFFTDYQKKYGKMCQSEVAVRCYDAMYILKAGIEAAGKTDGTSVRDGIYSLSKYEGLQGTFDFSKSHDGEGLTASRLYIIQGGKDVLLEDYLKKK